MLNLFDVVPSSFFNFLGSASNNRIYSDCLLIIYNEYENEISYRLPRTRIRDAVAFYLSDIHSELVLEDGIIEKNYSDMASTIIRKLCSDEVAWLEEDSDETTYEKQIIMTEQGILLAEFLERLKSPGREEFSSYIFNIFNILNNVDQWNQDPYSLCLVSVYKNSRSLSKALKKLATFIRNIIEDMMNENTFESLTENIISYCEGDFIKEYSRLTKRQNIHFYRRTIISRLKEFESDEKRMEELVTGCASDENISIYDARLKVLDMLQKTEHFLEVEYDSIMNDIKHKINVYLQIAVGRGRFLRNRGMDVRGSVEQTIKYIALEMDQFGMRDELPDNMTDFFNLERNEFIDLDSLRYPAKQKVIRKSVIQEYESLEEEDYLNAKREQTESSFNPYSKELMKEYLDRQMEGHLSLNSRELPLNTKNDLLTELSAIAYSSENGYSITPQEEFVEINNMFLRTFEIRREL